MYHNQNIDDDTIPSRSHNGFNESGDESAFKLQMDEMGKKTCSGLVGFDNSVS